ncbi:cytochrome P450 [Oceanobacillus halotolerans]|uniref:cytochrome P450 n=1 Tax=Oceanobacillus halotolerans TaxID=2663380 RepID=UPI0013DCFEB0|nr:cytochrome P450 [Oceanobacillus halotolerans]
MTSNYQIPVDHGTDNSLQLLMEGYHYIPNRCRKYNTKIFETHILGGQKAICIQGKEAAEIFYDNERFQRKGAAPPRIQKSLFGVNAVQTMDGKAHQHRKKLFMSLMTPERIQLLKEITEQQWDIAIDKWENMDGRIELFTETEEMMTRIACQWAGVPLRASELTARASDLGALIDAFGAVGPRHWHGRIARPRIEAWIMNVIDQVRNGNLKPPEDTPLHAFSWHRDLNGNLLSTNMAAVELINIIRPIVAIGRYITFGALALHDYPETKEKLQEDDGTYSQMFVQEVRRYYPFGPFLGARVKKDFTWNGHAFKQGTMVLLDIYGTNHDPELWDNPDRFYPERFYNWEGSPFDFIPQGGGDYHMGHRCAGEWVTIEVMKTSLDIMAKKLAYSVPDQNLEFSMVRMPSIPKSRFIIENVRRI